MRLENCLMCIRLQSAYYKHQRIMSLFKTAQKIDFFVSCSRTDKCTNILVTLPEDVTYLNASEP